MNPEELQSASYRGAVWRVTSTSLTGGRKNSRKQFIGSDRELIEDLGKRQREFTLSGIVAAERNNEGSEIRSYRQVRDTLLDALEAKGTGILIHPFLGRLENIAVLSFSFTEDIKKLGESPIEVTFGVSNVDGLPQVKEKVFDGVSTANTAVVIAVETSVADTFSVTESFTGNFSDAIEQGNDFIDAVNAATSPLAIDTAAVDSFNKELSDFSTNIASLVDTPQDFAESITSLYGTMNGLYSTPEATLEAFKRLFDFGDNDTSISQNTAGRVERQKNRDIINGSVQGLALSYSYLSASSIIFTNVDEVDEVSEDLEVQYQKLILSDDLESDVAEEITKMRIEVTEFFDTQRLTAPKVITINTGLTSSRLLAYQFYGSSDLGDTLAELNNVDDPTSLEGDVLVLTT